KHSCKSQSQRGDFAGRKRGKSEHAGKCRNSVMTQNNFPKLHNAMWPGLVGKGSPGAEPCIDLDTMLELTANAEVNGTKFDGVDIFLFDPHVSIDVKEDELKAVADKI